uniref:G-protein coupled receptors family 1 profile domain-containing protein n=1 Tax=Ciona savignyi TaxID=51511 RepID=H2ZAE7_CIOSA
SIAKTSVMRLPTIGLDKLQELNAFSTPYLVRFPASDQLPSLHKALLTYPFHCCALKSDYGFGQIYRNEESSDAEGLVDCNADDDVTSVRIVPSIPSSNTLESVDSFPETPVMHNASIHCSPVPDLFNPCEDLLGSPGIVAVSWSVACLAVVGNFFVIFMLLAVACDRTRAQQRHLSVPKFLILNLAIGDFFMGIYLFILTAMDSRSSGSYYKFGVEWQSGGGCDVAGFISIFASQLSVFTLSVISLERWYAIRYAIQLDKRMTLRCGRIVMSVGWLVAIMLAALPLMNVNSYRKTAICLPMDVQDLPGKVYVAALLSIDICAFVLVVGSLISLFFSPYSSEGCYGVMDRRKTDARVAKRMAVLVFTDFACFFPICFFSLFALAGLPLLSMSTAKVLLITCFPFNACCNPFLYAILTK